MARSARRHFINAAIIGLFALVFAGFLATAAYYFVTGSERATLQSFAPGVPAFFLFFLARKEWRNGVVTRQMAVRRRAKEAAGEV